MLVVLIIASLCFLGAFIYYNNINKAEDPRVVQTKFLFKSYDKLLIKDKLSEALPLLDSIDAIFLNTPGYADSYERGIVYNNKASVFLTLALYSNNDSLQKSAHLVNAKYYVDSSIVIYQNWLEKYGSMDEDLLLKETKIFFQENDSSFKKENYKRIVRKRVNDLLLAQKETNRRLSVCYTNLGIIFRHQYQVDEALRCYINALKLWQDNYTARNNFNVLMGRTPEDRSVIDQLFPPPKNKFN